MLNKLFKIFAVLLFCFCGAAIAGSDVHVTVKLDRIKAKQLAEERGDEIYFSVTAYPSEKRPGTTSRVPVFPLHWLSKNLDDVRNITMWEQTIKDGSAVQLIISLVEQDLPPWNIDDHLGSVKLTLTNKGGNLTKKWSLPNYNDDTKVNRNSSSNTSPNFTFKGEGATYNAKFVVSSAIKG